MATIKFLLQSTNDPANIYLRLSVDRKTVIKRKTGYVINPDNWSSTTNLPKQGDANQKQLKTDLGKLATAIEEHLNAATTKGEEITGDWLQNKIDTFQGKKKKTDLDRLSNYIQHYVDNLKYKEYSNGKSGSAKGTNSKYLTIKTKVEEFENYTKRQYYLKDVDLNFRNELLDFFTTVDKLGSNTAGRYVSALKTICRDAQDNGLEVNTQLWKIKGFTEKASKVVLCIEELEMMLHKKYERAALENAKDWLIIGCFIGQRVSDLLTLTRDNINVRNGLELIELVQKKTKKHVAIPIHPYVRLILNKHNGDFPSKISDQKFNLHVKDVCELAGITEITDGAKLIAIGKDKEKKWRKALATYPKFELMTSHVCRRSFATNFYGEMPTPLIMSITAHATERQFLEYIGKTSNDYAIQIAEFWNKQTQLEKKESEQDLEENK